MSLFERPVRLVGLACLLVCGTAAVLITALSLSLAVVDEAFPLPAQYTQIADLATDVMTGVGQCDGNDVQYASFDAASWHWMLLRNPIAHRAIFVQYTLDDHSRPLRQWTVSDDGDEITVMSTVADPASVYPDGPCQALFVPYAGSIPSRPTLHTVEQGARIDV